jgi:hypothetical protein
MTFERNRQRLVKRFREVGADPKGMDYTLSLGNLPWEWIIDRIAVLLRAKSPHKRAMADLVEEQIVLQKRILAEIEGLKRRLPNDAGGGSKTAETESGSSDGTPPPL